MAALHHQADMVAQYQGFVPAATVSELARVRQKATSA